MRDSADITPGLRYIGLMALRPSEYVNAAINLLLGGAGVAAFFQLLIGGVQWIMSGGEKEALERAKRRIIHSLIGLTVVFSSYALLFVIRALFGIDVVSVDLRPIR